jgi:pimeloyl-ACP methyl ester carboxylesterase
MEKIRITMKLTAGFLCLLLSFTAYTAVCMQLQTGNTDFLHGSWRGKVDAGVMKFTLVFKFTRSGTGSLEGTLDIIEQDALGLPVDRIVVRNDSLLLSLTKINRKYAGRINSNRTQIEGVYIRGGAPSLKLNLTKVDTVIALKRPQTPQPPYPYKEEQVTFSNKTDQVTLAGTLTIPEGKSKYPAIILISGSGAQDRDETIFGHKPFLVMADYFTRRGFAVLRFDDRGVGGSGGGHLQATTRINSEDVQSAIGFLCARKDIKKEKIVLIGHSEGVIIASMAAVENTQVSGIVLLGAPGLRIDENLYLQNAVIRKAEGASDEEIARFETLQKAIFTVVKEESNDSIARIKLRDTYSSNRYQQLTRDQKISIDGKISTLLTPYFRDIIKCDPVPIISKVRVKALVITGEKDLQCPPGQNLPVIEEALKSARNKNYTIAEMDGVNHMLQTCKTGAMSEYATIEETINPKVLITISDWLENGEQQRKSLKY